MRTMFLMSLFLALTGCLAGVSQGRTTTEYLHDNGVHPVQRTTVTQTASGSTFGGGLPMVVMAGGYGGAGSYGPGAMQGGASCMLHPDSCAVVQVATVQQQAVVTSLAVSGVGGSGSAMVGAGGAGTYGPPRDTSDLEERIARVEAAVPKLAGAGILSLRQSCHVILKEPALIGDEAERAKIVAGCVKLVKSTPKADAASEEK